MIVMLTRPPMSSRALLAAGEKLHAYAKQGSTPLDRLLAFQNKSGAFRFQDSQADDNAGATYQAVPALLGQTFPYVGSALPAVTPVVPRPADRRPPSPTSPQPVAGGTPARLPNTGDDDARSGCLLSSGRNMCPWGWSLRRPCTGSSAPGAGKARKPCASSSAWRY